MGSRRARRQAFFSTHPHCCFCGGSAVATTEDHVPGRSLFAERAWPEGYVFPSCESCNRGSAEGELFMGFLVRIPVRASTPTERVERQKAIEGIHARYPTFFANFQRAPRVETRPLHACWESLAGKRRGGCVCLQQCRESRPRNSGRDLRTTHGCIGAAAGTWDQGSWRAVSIPLSACGGRRGVLFLDLIWGKHDDFRRDLRGQSLGFVPCNKCVRCLARGK